MTNYRATTETQCGSFAPIDFFCKISKNFREIDSIEEGTLKQLSVECNFPYFAGLCGTLALKV